MANSSGPIESKVTSSTVAATLIGVTLAVLNAVQEDPELLGVLPVWLQSLALAVVPGLIVFVSGYAVRHTPRPDVTGGSANLS